MRERAGNTLERDREKICKVSGMGAPPTRSRSPLRAREREKTSASKKEVAFMGSYWRKVDIDFSYDT